MPHVARNGVSDFIDNREHKHSANGKYIKVCVIKIHLSLSLSQDTMKRVNNC